MSSVSSARGRAAAGPSLLELRNLMLRESEAAERPLPTNAMSAKKASDGQVSYEAQEQGWEAASEAAGVAAVTAARVSRDSLEGATTPSVPRDADRPLRCSTLDSLTSAVSSGSLGAACEPDSPAAPPPLPTVKGQLSLTTRSTLQSPKLRPSSPGSSAAAPLEPGSVRRSYSVLGSASHSPRLPAKASPVLPLEPRLSRRLSKMCRRAVTYMEELQRPGLRMVPGAAAAPTLPKTALRFCKGLTFLFEKRVGCFLGLGWARGFVVAQLPGGAWSAPCFLSSGHASLGMTLGFQSVQYCCTIATQAVLDAVKADSVGSGVDLISTFGQDPLTQGLDIKTLEEPPLAGGGPPRAQTMVGQSKTFYVADGVMLNASFKCGYLVVHDGMNTALYGEGCTPDQILGGGVQQPEEFAPLYRLVTETAATASVVKSTRSKFLICKQHTEKQLQKRLQREIKGGVLARAMSLASNRSNNDDASGTTVSSVHTARPVLRRSVTEPVDARLPAQQSLGSGSSLFPEVDLFPLVDESEVDGCQDSQHSQQAQQALGSSSTLFPEVEPFQPGDDGGAPGCADTVAVAAGNGTGDLFQGSRGAADEAGVVATGEPPMDSPAATSTPGDDPLASAAGCKQFASKSTAATSGQVPGVPHFVALHAQQVVPFAEN
ncbi:hypothetical protein N2152v2_003533 [Parachlorella kessleri]